MYPYSELLWSVFSPNVGKYGPENTEYGHFFHAVVLATHCTSNCLLQSKIALVEFLNFCICVSKQ